MFSGMFRQRRFAYSFTELDRIELSLSRERLAPYMALAQGDRREAIRLYERNTRISESFYAPIQGLEIALRNAFDRALASGIGRPDWYDVLQLLGPQNQALGSAKGSLTRSGKPHDPGRVIAELSFGFWTGLTGSGYSSSGLWNRHLHKAFANARVQRRQCHAHLERIRLLRNRIAHHESILSRDHIRDHDEILEVASWICADTRNWIADQSRVLLVLRPPRLYRVLGIE